MRWLSLSKPPRLSPVFTAGLFYLHSGQNGFDVNNFQVIAITIPSCLCGILAAALVTLLPLAYKPGIPGPVLLGVMPSVYAYFFIPNYPSDIATVNFDRSGTTKIGKYLLNHSFMLPGLTSVITSTIVGSILVKIFY